MCALCTAVVRYRANPQCVYVAHLILYLVALGDSGSGKTKAMNIVRKALRSMCIHTMKHAEDLGLSGYFVGRIRDYLLNISSDPTAAGVLAMFGRCTTSPPKCLVSPGHRSIPPHLHAHLQSSSGSSSRMLRVCEGEQCGECLFPCHTELHHAAIAAALLMLPFRFTASPIRVLPSLPSPFLLSPPWPASACPALAALLFTTWISTLTTHSVCPRFRSMNSACSL